MSRLSALRLAYQLATRAAGVAHFCLTMVALMRMDARAAREMGNWDRAEHGGVGVS